MNTFPARCLPFLTTCSRRGCLAFAVGLILGGPARGSEELTFFAFDDVSIPFVRNLALEMRSPQKHPANPVVPRGAAGTPD